ncbi:lipase family protein [Actinomadura hibisca]|uniref:lipase family protein n=1 Tax=Actinomadura hibisca TaxID=68565 RepID=UPI000A03538E|nr:lipase family protein [Actinomadura hibisca]
MLSVSLSKSARRGLGSALACVLSLALLQGPAAAAPGVPPPPAKDPFYKPPSPLPAGRPGDVIRARPSVFTLDPGRRSPYGGVKAWQLLYRSESATGGPIAVSGTVLVPAKPWARKGKRPLVSYAVGTRGLGDKCAPSYSLSRGLDYEELFIADALARGWAVAVTDMQGLGTPGRHTYVVGRSQGKAVLNMARAAQRLPGTGLDTGGPVGIWGYSEGGGSAGWAAQLAASYAPELAVKGTVAGGIPGKMRKLLAHNGGPFTLLLLMAAVGYDAAYPELDLDRYLNDRGRRMLAKYQDACVAHVDVLPLFLDTAFRRISDFTVRDPLDDPRWRARLDENDLGLIAPSAPVFDAQALLDEVIPYGQAEQVRRDWCARGANVTWQVYPVAEHLLGAVFAEPASVAFLDDRFHGRPTRGNCA